MDEINSLGRLYSYVYRWKSPLLKKINENRKKYGRMLAPTFEDAVKLLEDIYRGEGDEIYNTDPVTAELIVSSFAGAKRTTPFVVEVNGRPQLTWWGTEIIALGQYEAANNSNSLVSAAKSAIDAAERYIAGRLDYNGYYEP